MNNELKSCPFCGGEARIEDNAFTDAFFIMRERCHTTSDVYSTKNEAIEAWNTRAYERECSDANWLKFSPIFNS